MVYFEVKLKINTESITLDTCFAVITKIFPPLCLHEPPVRIFLFYSPCYKAYSWASTHYATLSLFYVETVKIFKTWTTPLAWKRVLSVHARPVLLRLSADEAAAQLCVSSSAHELTEPSSSCLMLLFPDMS